MRASCEDEDDNGLSPLLKLLINALSVWKRLVSLELEEEDVEVVLSPVRA